MECVETSFDLFSKPAVQIGLDDVGEYQILPLSGVTSDTVIEFVLPAENVHLIDLSSIKLYVRIKVTKSDGTAVEANAIELSSLWGQCLFREVSLELSHKNVTVATNNYPFRAYLETLLSVPTVVKKEQLAAIEDYEGWKVKDFPEREVLMPLHLDLCNQPRLLVNGVEAKIKCIRADEAFVLKKLSPNTDQNVYKIHIQKIVLFVKKYTPNPSFMLEQTEMMQSRNAIYPIQRCYIKSFNLTQGSVDRIINNAFLGQLPTKIIVACLKTATYNGTTETHPFEFEHFNLSHLSLDVNGRSQPLVPYEPNFDLGFCRREYYGLLETVLGYCVEQESIGLSFEDYTLKNKCLFGFALTAPSNTSGTRPPRRTGTVDIRMKFRKPLEQNVTVLAYAEYDNTIEIDSGKNVYADFTV